MKLNVKKIKKIYQDIQRPMYLYDLNGIAQRCHQFRKAIELKNVYIHYAMKANSNLEVLRTIHKAGFGVDVVSGGELKRALNVGFHPKQIIFSGVGKTKVELEFAIKKSIKQINVESIQELERIVKLTNRLQKKAEIGIRINPNIKAKTHPFIATGFYKNKFGIDMSELPKAETILSKNSKYLKWVGVSLHVGSQILDLKVFEDSIKKGMNIFKSLRQRGWELSRLNIGGGLGIDYKKDFHSDLNQIFRYGKLLGTLLKNLDSEIQLEPGRILVARFGILVGQVEYIKQNRTQKFAILNTGSHHLIRPVLYGAYHRIIPLTQRKKQETYQIVGPLCESSDFLAQDRKISELRPGDLVAIMDAGAYGYTMASTFNLHDLPVEISI